MKEIERKALVDNSGPTECVSCPKKRFLLFHPINSCTLCLKCDQWRCVLLRQFITKISENTYPQLCLIHSLVHNSFDPSTPCHQLHPLHIIIIIILPNDLLDCGVKDVCTSELSSYRVPNSTSVNILTVRVQRQSNLSWKILSKCSSDYCTLGRRPKNGEEGNWTESLSYCNCMQCEENYATYLQKTMKWSVNTFISNRSDSSY